MRLLMDDLRLNSDRAVLKKILENAVPKTYQDVVVVYVSVTGQYHNVLMEDNYMKKIYPQVIAGQSWSAIQITTAAGMCAVVDMTLMSEKPLKGFIYQEQFSLTQFLDNRFGKYYRH
jgi:saccharopine dehydrogenase-like NADP-dependent oxidoreductase